MSEINTMTRDELAQEVRRLLAALRRTATLEEALRTILVNTEPGAIKHRDYDHLAKDIADAARSALEATL
jgi:hypothetical protein